MFSKIYAPFLFVVCTLLIPVTLSATIFPVSELTNITSISLRIVSSSSLLPFLFASNHANPEILCVPSTF